MTPLISADQPAAIDVAGLRVSFAGTRALDGIDLRISAGRIHGLLGGNGSGKSTLIKVLAGVQKADTGGTVSLFGRTYPADQLTPSVAMEAGLRFVHQDLGMFDDMTVAENFALYARYPTANAGRVNWRALHAEVGQLLERFEIDATPRTKTVHLRPAMRTMLAVARALRGDGGNGGRVLILDEPTVSLPAAEVDSLLEALRRRAASGETIVFVGHRLAEVLSLADDLTVVRDGSVVASLDAGSTTHDQLVELIAGRPISNIYPPASDTDGGTAVTVVEHLEAGPVRDANLVVHAGEIVGVAGLLGSGRSSLLRALFGDLPVRSGTVRVGTKTGPFRSPDQAMRAGVGYVPESRVAESAFLDMSVSDNLSATVVGDYFNRLWLRRDRELVDAEKLMKAFLIRAGSLSSPLSHLSGGNQQKVMLARWMRRSPRLLLLDEPTQGVDVGARADIYQLIRKAATDQSAVVVVSSDLEELANMCDRVVVLKAGRIRAELTGAGLTPSLLWQAVNRSEQGQAA